MGRLAASAAPDPWPLLVEERAKESRSFERANATPAAIDLGSCVKLSPAGGWARGDLTEDGVVIEVVPPGCGVRSVGVTYPRSTGSSRSTVIRYVVQCEAGRLVRRAAELEVVCL